ncbi:MAG TPA: IS607 family transposase [Bacteroidetes bacterium]|nr:IS607 family transposase [Bacteroidota bacterium]
MYSIGTFSKKIGVTIETLRHWDKQNKLKPAFISEGKHRYYSEEQLNELLQKKNITKRINLGYIRVSTRKQKDDLERQHQLMELYLTKQGKEFKIISDIGSGINYNKKGLKELLKLISTNQVDTLYLSFKDRLLRFGYELIEELCKIHNTNIVLIDKSDHKTNEEELVNDILNIIHVFSCKLNGKRSHINKKIMEKLQNDKK